ncbi:MAG: hypothetical protein RIS76_1654 [Verrucomicrobiota bacterium]
MDSNPTICGENLLIGIEAVVTLIDLWCAHPSAQRFLKKSQPFGVQHGSEFGHQVLKQGSGRFLKSFEFKDQNPIPRQASQFLRRGFDRATDLQDQFLVGAVNRSIADWTLRVSSSVS